MPGTRGAPPASNATHPRSAVRRRIALLLLTVLFGGQGCYSYHLAEIPSLRVGEQIRVALPADEYQRLVPGAEASGPRRLEGTFSGLTADSLVLSVWIGQDHPGTRLANARQDVFIPREDLAQVENRRFSGKRTALLVGGMVAAMAVLFNSVGFVDIFGSGGSTNIPQGPSPAPVFR